MQEHGYTLAAIERVLARIPVDAAPAEYAVQAAVLAPWLPEHSEQLDRAALERRVGRRITEAELGYLISIGALERTGADFRASPVVLGHAADRAARCGLERD